MIRFEALVLALAGLNGAFDVPTSKAFTLRNPLLLRTYRPEKKVDSEHYRVFSSVLGGFKAGLADLEAKCSGKNHRLSSQNTLRDMLVLYGFNNDAAVRKVVLFLQRALGDETISADTKLEWFKE